jgi:hypothetical protein
MASDKMHNVSCYCELKHKRRKITVLPVKEMGEVE